MSNPEEQIRERVRELRSFYVNAFTLGGASVLSILAWLLSGGGTFWPIWVILAAAISLGVQAFRLGMIPMLTDWFPFLNPEWEDQQVATMMKKGDTTSPKSSKEATKGSSKGPTKKKS